MSHFETPQEEDILPERTILTVLGVIVLIGVACVFVAWFILSSREAALRPSGVFDEQTLGPTGKNTQLEEVLFQEKNLPGEVERNNQKQAREKYLWVDQEKGLLQIPVEKSMELYLQGQKQ